MDTSDSIKEAVDVLQLLGLKEYEARCFVGLSRLNTGTAKKLSEMTEVPRTRVYDAIRVLEAQGLVEVQHSSPQQFRAVPLQEATETLRDQYEARVERLENALDTVEQYEDDQSPVQEVWAMSGRESIENRTSQLISEAEDEIVLVICDSSLLTADLVDTLNDIPADVDLVAGALSEGLQDQVQDAVPDATTFVSGLEWLRGIDTSDETAIGRLLLADRSAILVSSIMPETKEEQAVFGTGFGNGLVVVARRLMAQGLIPARDPEWLIAIRVPIDRYAPTTGSEITLSERLDYVMSNTDVSGGEAAFRSRVTTELTNTHLPALAELGFVEYNMER